MLPEARGHASGYVADLVAFLVSTFLCHCTVVWLLYGLFVTANYDWMLPEARGHASGYVADLVAFLDATFMSFTNLPVSIAFNQHCSLKVTISSFVEIFTIKQ